MIIDGRDPDAFAHGHLVGSINVGLAGRYAEFAGSVVPSDVDIVLVVDAGFELEAKNLRAVIREMDARFPGLGAYLEEETTVAIDGEIHETAYFQPLREQSEIYFLPKIEAG